MAEREPRNDGMGTYAQSWLEAYFPVEKCVLRLRFAQDERKSSRRYVLRFPPTFSSPEMDSRPRFREDMLSRE